MDKNAAIRQRMKDSQGKSASQSLVSAEKENLPRSHSASNDASSPFVSCYASGVDESSFHTADGKSILSNLMSPHPGGNESQNQSYWAMVGQYSLVHSTNKENSNQQVTNDSLISMSPAEKSSQNWSWQSSLLPDTSISPIKSMTPQKAATPAVSEDPRRYLDEWEKEAGRPQSVLEVVSSSQDDSDLACETLDVSDVLSPVSNSTLLATKQYLEKIQKLERELRATKQKVDDEFHRRNKFDQGVRDQQEHGELDISQSLDNAASSTHQRLVDRNKTLAKEVRFADQTCVELSGKNSALEREITVLREQLDHLRGRNDALQEKTAESQAQSHQLQQKVADLESICSKSESELDQVKKEKDNVYENLNKAKSEAVKWEFQCRFLQDQLDAGGNAKTEKQTEVESQLYAITEERNSLRANVEQLEKYVSDLQEERNQLQQEKLSLTTLKEVHCAEIHSMNNSLASTHEELCKAQNEASSARKQVDSLNDELVARETKHMEQLADQSSEVSKLQMKILKFQKSVGQQDSDAKKIEDQLRVRNEEFARLEMHITKVLEEKRDVELSLEESHCVVARLEKQLSLTRDSLRQNEVETEKVMSLLAQADQHAVEAQEKLIQGVKNLFEKASKMEANLGNQASQLHERLSNLYVQINFVSSVIDFDNELSVVSSASQEKEDEIKVESISRSLALNATLDLEKMEEARTTPLDIRHTMNADIGESPCISAGERSDLSSIQDISQFFPDGASKSPSDEILQEKNTAYLSPLTPGIKETGSSAPGRFHIRPFFDNEVDLSAGELRALRLSLQDSLKEQNSLLEKLKNVEQEKSILEGQLETRTRELNFELKHSTSLTRVVDDLTRSQKVTQEHATKVEQEKLEAVRKLREVENELHEARTRIADLVKDVNNLLQRQGESSHYSAELQETLLLAEREKKKYEEQMSAYCTQAAQAVNTIHELEDRIQESKGVAKDIETFRTRLVLLDSQLRETEAQLRLSEEKCAALREENQNYLDNSKSMLQENQVLVQERNNCLREISKLSKDLKSEIKKTQDLSLQVEVCTSKLLIKEDELQKLQAGIRCSKAELDEFKGSFAKNNDELLFVSQRHSELETLTKQMKEDYENRLSETLQSVQTDIERLRSERKTLVDESSDLKRQLDEQSARRDEAEIELERISNELQCTQKESHERDVELKSTKYALERANEALMGLKSSFLACNERLASLTAAHTDRENEIERYRNLLEAADDLESAATTRFLDAQNNFEQVQEERDRLQQECQTIAEKLRKVEKYYADWEKITSEKNDKQENDHIREIKDLQKVLDVTRRELENRDARIEQLLQAADELIIKQHEAETMVEQFNSFSEELSIVKEELNAAKNDAYQTNQQLEAMSELKASLDLKIRRLRDHIREQGKKIIRWEEYHGARGHFLEKIRDSNARTRESLAKLAKLYSDRDQPRSAPRTPWTIERSDLQYLHEQLETELFEISKELADVVPQFA